MYFSKVIGGKLVLNFGLSYLTSLFQQGFFYLKEGNECTIVLDNTMIKLGQYNWSFTKSPFYLYCKYLFITFRCRPVLFYYVIYIPVIQLSLYFHLLRCYSHFIPLPFMYDISTDLVK